MVAVVPAAGWAALRRDSEELRRAMTEDVVEVVSGLDVVEPVLALGPADPPGWAELVWPGTPVRTVPGHASDVLADLYDLGAVLGAVVAGDAPDLPGLLVGKLFRALGSAQVAVCPAADGTLVALAARLPAPDWLTGSGVGLDSGDAVGLLSAAAPNRRALSVGPGWHRLHGPGDLARLDLGLEGWEETRRLLRASMIGENRGR
jgi:hypothetical protein